jgi:serine/threonine protein kinase
VDDASGLAPDKQLGKYRLEGLLGRGGMGEVWAAHDPDLDRKVALKVLRPSAASTDDAQVRLLREGRAMARLRHPNVITVYEATRADGRDVIAMELIDGKSLAGWLTEHREPGDIVAALIAAGRGLAAAHAAGMVHRDFKPHNVLVDRDGRVVVTDFGLARALAGDEPATDDDAVASTAPGPAAAKAAAATTADDVGSAETMSPTALDETATAAPSGKTASTRPLTGTTADRAALHSPLTRTGALLGTPAYMAPEQIDGHGAGPRADQFAFCVTAWEALAGTRPFHGKNLVELRDAIDDAPAGADKVTGRLRPILARGLRRDPLARWPSMTALLDALDAAWRRPRRIKIAAIAIAGTAVAAAIPIAMALRPSPAAGGACPGFAEAFAPAQTQPVRDLVKALEAGGPAGVRAFAYVDKWRGAWRDAYDATCKQPKDPDFLARRSCLDVMRDTFVDRITMAKGAPPELLASTDPVQILPMPNMCVTHPRAAAPPPPADPAVRAEVQRIGAALIGFQLGPRGSIDQLPALSKLVQDARATRHDPVIADVLLVLGDTIGPHDWNAACVAFEESANVAERAGADVSRINALMGLIECSQHVAERRPATDALFERAGGLIDRVGLADKRAHLDTMRAGILGERGDWDAAIAAAAAAHRAWLAADAPVSGARAVIVEAEYRQLRGTVDDLVQAEKILRAALDTPAAHSVRGGERLRRKLAEVLWYAGRLDEAVAMLMKLAEPAPPGDLEVTVEVTGADGKPVERAEVIAAVEPVGDPVRLSRGELRPTVTARTDEHGVATMRIPTGAVIVARKESDLGTAAPTGAGKVAIALRPPAYIDGTVAVSPAQPTDAKASRIGALVAAATVRVGDRFWTTTAPVDERGRFRLTTISGRAVVHVEAFAPLGDARSAAKAVDLAPGGHEIALELSRGVEVRAIVRPAIEGLVIAVAGTHAARTWREVRAVVDAAPAVTVAFPAETVTRAGAVDGAQIGDQVVGLAAPAAGPVTVCALPGARSPYGVPVPILTMGPDDKPPVCVTAQATAGAVPTVLVSR